MAFVKPFHPTLFLFPWLASSLSPEPLVPLSRLSPCTRILAGFTQKERPIKGAVLKYFVIQEFETVASTGSILNSLSNPADQIMCPENHLFLVHRLRRTSGSEDQNGPEYHCEQAVWSRTSLFHLLIHLMNDRKMRYIY